jgi:methyl-accepting chemotaxis protein
MSERLLFELKAIDNATAPIRRVNDELTRTGSAVKRMGASMDVGTRNTRKFAMGALQQAGYQIGDFAVQIANGTSKMQAFGQQAPQILQIFGPIGAVIGAGVAIVAAFGVAMSKSGKELGNFGSALGVLREPLSAIVSAVMSVRGAFGSTFSFIVENIDTALIAAALYASFIGVRFVAASVAAAYANGAFALSLAGVGAAFSALQAIMLRFLPFVVILGVAKLIEVFMRLVKGAGSVGEAFSLLNDVAVEAFGRIGTAFDIVVRTVNAGSVAISAYFTDKLAEMGMSFIEFANQVANTLNYLFNTNIQGPSDQIFAEMTFAAAAMGEQVRITNQEIAGMKDELASPMQSWTALKDAIAAGTEEVTFFGDASVAATDKAGAGVEKLTQQQETMKSIAEGIRSSFSEAFMSMVDGTKTVLGAFKDMVRQIILKLYEQLVVQQMVNAAMGVVGSVFPALAPALSGFKAMGGPVTSGQPYMVGERGPEIIVPSRNGNVIPNNQLGGGGVTVNQTINITTGVQQTVRAEIKSLMPQIADSAKAAVLDARRRGGSYGSAFA